MKILIKHIKYNMKNFHQFLENKNCRQILDYVRRDPDNYKTIWIYADCMEEAGEPVEDLKYFMRDLDKLMEKYINTFEKFRNTNAQYVQFNLSTLIQILNRELSSLMNSISTKKDGFPYFLYSIGSFQDICKKMYDILEPQFKDKYPIAIRTLLKASKDIINIGNDDNYNAAEDVANGRPWGTLEEPAFFAALIFIRDATMYINSKI